MKINQLYILMLLMILFTKSYGQNQSLQYYINEAHSLNEYASRLAMSNQYNKVISVSLDKKYYTIASQVSDSLLIRLIINRNHIRYAMIDESKVKESELKDLDFYKIVYKYKWYNQTNSDSLVIDIRPAEVLGHKIYLKAKQMIYEDESIELYEKAALLGNIKSIALLAYYYENGYVVKRNYEKAFEYYNYLVQHHSEEIEEIPHSGLGKSDYSNHPYLYHLALFHYWGLGCKQDVSMAISEFKTLAEHYHEDSMYYLGKYYYDKKMYKEAVFWFQKTFETYNNKFVREPSSLFTTGESLRLLSSCYRYNLGILPNKDNIIIADSLMRASMNLFNKDAYIVYMNNSSDSNRQNVVLPDMVYVKGGKFKMGISLDQKKNLKNIYNADIDITPEEICYPSINVKLDDYYLGTHEVTQKEWLSIMGYNNSIIKGDNLPVHNISWYEIQEFIHQLNNLTGKKYRLPTEAEWEYAARGGSMSYHYTFIGGNDYHKVAWTKFDTSDVHPVCSKSPNELGLYDLAGNVFEWCNDWFGGYGIYKSTTVENPNGLSEEEAKRTPSYGFCKVIRGGSVGHYFGCTASWRWMEFPARQCINGGFRLCESIN